jgi:hypothetical protein
MEGNLLNATFIADVSAKIKARWGPSTKNRFEIFECPLLV